MERRQAKARGWFFRCAAGAVAVTVVSALAPAPASAHYEASIRHLWRHIRAKADARYLQLNEVRTLRGQYLLAKETASAAGEIVSGDISFGLTLSAAPTRHVISSGGTPPAECPGTTAMPEALPGHLCIYEAHSNNAGTLEVQDAAGIPGTSSPFGTMIYVLSQAAGYVESRGTWAVTMP